MRLLTLSGLATLTVAALFGVQAAAARADAGGDSRQLVGAERASQGSAQGADRLQRALAACRARGFADGSGEQRRCAEQLLAGGTATTTVAAPPGAGAQPTDRQQRALAACRARGFADGSGEQRRCAEQLLAGGTAPATTTSPPRVVRGPVVTDRGIVQSVAVDALVLRALDGSSLTVALDLDTRIYVGDRDAGVADVQPGSVATVRHFSAGPALDVRVALPPKPKLRTDRGVTDSVSSSGIVIRLGNGATRSIPVSSSTRVQGPNSREVSLSVLGGGLLVDVLYDPSGTVPAQSVKIIRRAS